MSETVGTTEHEQCGLGTCAVSGGVGGNAGCHEEEGLEYSGMVRTARKHVETHHSPQREVDTMSLLCIHSTPHLNICAQLNTVELIYIITCAAN